MKDELFKDLLQSAKEAVAFSRGEATASRIWIVEAPDAKAIRTRQKVSQNEFARLLGISVSTLQNWEQGRRVPEGPARVLLQVVDRHPEVVKEAVRSMIKEADPKKFRQKASRNGAAREANLKVVA